MITSLDLGCGIKPKNVFNADVVHGIDIRNDAENLVVKADLVIENIPFPENTFDYVTALDFLEHIPRLVYLPHRRNSFVELMNEIWRVMKEGGIFLSKTPAYPYPSAFVDPTHVNIITEQTFPRYFDNTNRWASMYGFIGSFQVIDQQWSGEHLISQLRKVK
jgi:SAM-dependent methyltransferase